MSLGYEASVIFVKDVSVSRMFYEGLLGQTVMADHGENVVYVSDGGRLLARTLNPTIVPGWSYSRSSSVSG